MEGITRQALLDPLVGTIAAAARRDGRRRAGAADGAARRCAATRRRTRRSASSRSEHPSLAVMSVYLWATVDREPSRRPSAARTLLMLDAAPAPTSARCGASTGRSPPRSTPRCCSTYHDAEREPPEHDVERALESLMSASLDDVDRGNPLALALRGLPDHLDMPAYCAWYAAARRPGHGAAARRVGADRRPRPERVRGRRAVRARRRADRRSPPPSSSSRRRSTGYFEALDRLRRATTRASTRRSPTRSATRWTSTRTRRELLAMMFTIWSKAPDGGGARAARPAARARRAARTASRDDEVRSHLGPRRQAEWDEFVQRHGKRPLRPRPRALRPPWPLMSPRAGSCCA